MRFQTEKLLRRPLIAIVRLDNENVCSYVFPAAPAESAMRAHLLRDFVRWNND